MFTFENAAADGKIADAVAMSQHASYSKAAPVLPTPERLQDEPGRPDTYQITKVLYHLPEENTSLGHFYAQF